jgi:ribosome-associated heat shock protein Hsp15
MSATDDGCRADVWLWRARLFKTRTLAARMIEEGRVRLIRGAAEQRIDKPSRTLRPGDGVVMAMGGRVIALKVVAPGSRRGPPAEARTLYSELDKV